MAVAGIEAFELAHAAGMGAGHMQNDCKGWL